MIKTSEVILNLDELKGSKATIEGYISNLELAETKFNSKYLKFNINDETGTLSAKIWDESRSKKLFEYLSEKDLKSVCATVECTVKEYQGQPDLSADIVKVNPEGDISEYFEKSLIDFNQYKNQFESLIRSVKDEELSKLLNVIFFNPESGVFDKFSKWPAATFNHHNYIHGLLEHTVNVVELAISIAKTNENIYPVDYNLLIAGGLLHDIGKIYEYDIKDGVNYSEEGEFIYHTVSGPMLVHEINITEGLNISRDKLMKVIHLLSSHHGEYAEHTPNSKCFEAHILSFADNTDAKVNGIARDFAKGKAKKMKKRIQ